MSLSYANILLLLLLRYYELLNFMHDCNLVPRTRLALLQLLFIFKKHIYAYVSIVKNSYLEIYSFAGSHWDCILNILFQQSLHIYDWPLHSNSLLISLSYSTLGLSFLYYRTDLVKGNVCQGKFKADAHYVKQLSRTSYLCCISSALAWPQFNRRKFHYASAPYLIY